LSKRKKWITAAGLATGFAIGCMLGLLVLAVLLPISAQPTQVATEPTNQQAIRTDNSSAENDELLAEMISRNTEKALEAKDAALTAKWLFWLAVVGGGGGLLKLWFEIRKNKRDDNVALREAITSECEALFTSEEFERRREKAVKAMIRESINDEFNQRGPSFADAKLVDGMQKQISGHDANFRDNSKQLGEIQRQLGELSGLIKASLGLKQ